MSNDAYRSLRNHSDAASPSRWRHARARPLAAIFASIGALALAGCAAEPSASDAAIARDETARSAATVGSTGLNACVGTEGHDGHAAAGLGCAVCHTCGGLLGFGLVTFPGGTSTANGTLSSAGGTTTCSVGCHSPLGADPQTVAWNAGPLQCTSCHSNVAILDPTLVLSSHLVTAGSASCESCHDQSQHTSGEVRLLNGDGTATSGTCVGCHSGQGQTLAGQTPPLLVGWSDGVRGDFHGAREGTCRFDRLDSAGQRSIGQGGLVCPAEQPGSPNALRITSRWWYRSGTSGPWAWTCDIEKVDVNGNQIAPTRIAQACPAGTILNSSCNSPLFPSRCYPTTLVTRGFGGELVAPFERGQDALPCATCHDFHSSTNAFLLASRVNGVTIAAATVDRAGVGAQALCNACHEGDRHQLCKSCHREIWTTDGEYSWFEGAPVDPVPDGSACFYCHGHEGIRFMEVSSPAYPPSGHPFGIGGSEQGSARLLALPQRLGASAHGVRRARAVPSCTGRVWRHGDHGDDLLADERKGNLLRRVRRRDGGARRRR
jgi:predicted CxxxxCH...CXXCH cytochrome family protein